jgi:hypothetical protein
MNRVLELLRSLGGAGAVTNAGALASARRREDWVVAALERSVTRSTPATAPIRRVA